MECKSCQSKWKMDTHISVSIVTCPFCGTSLVEDVPPAGNPPFDNSREALAYILKEHGVDVLLGNNLKGWFSDYAPKINRGKKRIILSVYRLGVSQILQKNLAADSDEKQAAFRRAISKLIDDGNAPELAEEIICEFI